MHPAVFSGADRGGVVVDIAGYSSNRLAFSVVELNTEPELATAEIGVHDPELVRGQNAGDGRWRNAGGTLSHCVVTQRCIWRRNGPDDCINYRRRGPDYRSWRGELDRPCCLCSYRLDVLQYGEVVSSERCDESIAEILFVLLWHVLAVEVDACCAEQQGSLKTADLVGPLFLHRQTERA